MEIALRDVRESDLEMIMNWRMSEGVTKYMNTNPRLTIEGQREWLKKTEVDNNVRNWLIEVDKVPVGLINLAHIDWDNRTTSWGYYIGEEKSRSLSLAISLEMSLYDYVFDVLEFCEVRNETFSLSLGVIKLHQACGCEIVGVSKGEVEKEGIVYDVTHMTITDEKWRSIRPKKKYTKINFDVLPTYIGGVIPHHIGIAVSNLDGSVLEYTRMGWKCETGIIKDYDRNVMIMLMRNTVNQQLLELVSPMADNSPISKTLQIMNGVASPYHFCYEVNHIERYVQIFKKRHYFPTTKIAPAVAFGGRNVVFLVNKNGGLIELLERE